jgi:hypothetical protein
MKKLTITYLPTSKQNRMTNKEEARLSMYLTFKEYQAGYTAITNLLPNYAANSTIFLNTIPQIQAYSQKQKTSTKGVAEGKKQLRENLIVTTADYFRKLGTFAKFTNNVTLAQEVKIPESKLRQVADTAVKDYAQIAYDRAQTNVASLAAYGITAATQTSFLSAINAYNASIGKPGATRTESGLTTQQLKTLFKTAETALANMDAAVEIVRLTQGNFYNGYQNARKIIYTGTSSLAVKALITDASSGAPIKGATVSFSGNGVAAKAKAAEAKPELVKKTAEKGGFNIKTMPAGIYNVTVKKNGYTELTTTITVSDGEQTELNVQLTKN